MDRKARAEQLRGREVRRITTSHLECRDDGGALRVAGYASTTGIQYDMGWYQEQISRGAFTKTLSEGPDVQLLVNHEGLPLARTTNGTLNLREDEVGLSFDATLDAEDPDAARVASKIRQRLMDQCSFAFRVTRQSWDEDYENRDITEVSLDRGDVSVVNFGANPTTSVSMRSLFADLADLGDDQLAEIREDPAVITVVRRLALPSRDLKGVFAELASSPAGALEALRDEEPVLTVIRRLADNRKAIAPHSTATDDGAWDGPANVARLSNDDGATVYRKEFAWVDPDKDPDTKAAYKFPHHLVGGDGSVGAASLAACSAGIGALNGGRTGANIPDADRQGVYDHLAKHLKDGGRDDIPQLNAAYAEETRSGLDSDVARARVHAMKLRSPR